METTKIFDYLMPLLALSLIFFGAFSRESWWWLVGLNILLLFFWFIYAVVHLNIPTGRKWLLALFIVGLELMLAATLVFFFLFSESFYRWRDDIYLISGIYFPLHLLMVCLYKIRQVRTIQVLTGCIVGVTMAVYMYYNGTVIGDGEFMRSFTLGESFGTYQLKTYFCDIVYPFSLLWNILISPFWLRKKKSN